MRRYFRFITSHPIPVLALAFALAAFSGSFLLRLSRDTSPDSFVPPEHPALALKKKVDADFGLTDPIAVAVIRDAEHGIFVPETLRRIQELTRRIQALEGVEPADVVSIATEYGVFFEDSLPGYEQFLTRVPDDRGELDALRRTILGYELYRGTLIAEDGSAAMIVVRPSAGANADALYRQMRALLADFPVDNERLFVAGEAAVQAHMGKAVSDDALRMNFVSPLVMFALIVLAYLTLRATVLPICVVGGASALALGLMGASGVPVYIVTNGIFVIIMALGVADSLHLLGQYYEEQLDRRGRTRQDIVVDACTALWYPLLITSATDFAGFFVLFLVGGMPPIEYFGLFTCVGVVGALVYSYTVVPAGLAVLPLRMSRVFLARRRRSRGGDSAGDEAQGSAVVGDAIGRLMGGVGVFACRRRRAVLVFGAVVVAVAGWGASYLQVNDARILAFKDEHPIARAAAAINERFDGTSHLGIVVESSAPGAILMPDVLRKIDALETFSESLPHVGGTHSLAGWVKRAHQKMHGDDPAFYGIPDDPSDTKFYLDTLLAPSSPMGRLLREVIDPTYTRTHLIVRMRSSEYIHEREVIESLETYLQQHFDSPGLSTTLAGRVNLDYRWLQMIRSSHIRSVCFSLACVLLLTGLMFRSVVAGFLCTLTVGLAVLVSYAVMGLGGIPLGVGTSMFASISIGAGVNFPIHILYRLRDDLRGASAADREKVFQRALAFTGRALFFTAFIVAIGFLLLCVSEFRTLVRFGLLIGLGMVLSFLASVTFLPAIVAVLEERKAPREQLH